MAGTLTLTELQDEVKTNLGNRTEQDSRIITGLNLSQVRIARLHEWEELEALYTQTPTFTGTPATDKLLALPSSVRDVYSLRVLDGIESQKLTRLTNRRFDKAIPNTEALSTGRPHIYTLFRNVAELYRIPDQAYEYEVRAKKWPTEFTAGSPSSVSDLDRKDDLLIALTTSWVFMQLGNEESANKWWAIYKNLAQSAINEENEKPDLDISPDAGQHTGTYYADPFVKESP